MIRDNEERRKNNLGVRLPTANPLIRPSFSTTMQIKNHPERNFSLNRIRKNEGKALP
jgi:hypothetical protein